MVIRKRKRVLFLAETVTLAHLSRALALAKSLDPNYFEVIFACDIHYKHLMGELAFPTHSLRSIPSGQFLRSLARGAPIFSTDVLDAYVKEDIALLSQVEPDIVIGDLRISLSISARVARVPYVCITNAYWSPYAETRYPVPDFLLTRMVGVAPGQFLFNVFRSAGFAAHAIPLNRVRRRYGLKNLKFDLRHCLTDADYTLYADMAEVVPCGNLPAHHHYIGPIFWEPDVSLPIWWEQLPDDRPIVYVTMGSSGASEVLPHIVEALASMAVTAVVATAGRCRLDSLPDNVFATDFLPGVVAARRAQLVICNGGSPTAYQALNAGSSILGIATNLDQYMNMWNVEKAGAGKTLRAGQATAKNIGLATQLLLSDAVSRSRAQHIGKQIQLQSASLAFSRILSNIPVAGWT